MALVSVSQVAKALDVSERYVQVLVKRGMPKERHGKYDLGACMAWYIRYLHRKYAAGGVEAEETLEEAVTLRTLNAARQRLILAQADREELELARARAALIPVHVYEERVAAQIMQARQRVLALPGRVAPSLEGETRTVIKARLTDAVRQTLASLAAAGPPPYAATTAGDDSLPEGSRDAAGAAVGSAAKSARQRVGRAQPSPA